MTNHPAALSPYRVLDLSTEFGQYGGRAFAEMGAEVIKVEPPAGDPVRRLGPFFKDDPKPDRSLLWFVLNASKRGVTLNLESHEGRGLFRRLVATTDIVFESYQPGYLHDLGIDYDAFKEAHPRLVWVSVTGFGHDGPYQRYKWCDLVILALGGLLNLWGDEGRPPVRARFSQSYFHAAMAAASVGAIALYHRNRTGQGQYVDVSAQEIETVTLSGPGGITGFWPMQQQNITRSGPRMNLGFLSSRIFYRCKDGHVALGTLFGAHFPTLVELMKKDNMADVLVDPRWAGATRYSPLPGQWQITEEDELKAERIVTAWLERYTMAEINQMAAEHDLLIFPVWPAHNNLESPQLAARDYWTDIDYPELGTAIRHPGPPIKLSETPWQIRGRAPTLGEHNAAVYGELGLGPGDLEMLSAVGAI